MRSARPSGWPSSPPPLATTAGRSSAICSPAARSPSATNSSMRPKAKLPAAAPPPPVSTPPPGPRAPVDDPLRPTRHLGGHHPAGNLRLLERLALEPGVELVAQADALEQRGARRDVEIEAGQAKLSGQVPDVAEHDVLRHPQRQP